MTSPLQQLKDHAQAAQDAITAQRESAAQIAADAQAAREQAQQALPVSQPADAQGQAQNG